ERSTTELRQQWPLFCRFPGSRQPASWPHRACWGRTLRQQVTCAGALLHHFLRAAFHTAPGGTVLTMDEIAGETDLIAEAITEAFGERCPDFNPACWCCRAWKRYDYLKMLAVGNMVEAALTPPKQEGAEAQEL